MAATKEELVQDYYTYLGYVEKIENLQENMSDSIQSLVQMNRELVFNHRYEKNIRSVIGLRFSVLQIVSFAAVPLLIIFLLLTSILGPYVSFFLGLAAGIWAYDKLVRHENAKGGIPYVELAEEQKTQGYVDLENEISSEMEQINQEKEKYKNYSEGSSIIGLLPSYQAIDYPQIPDYDNYEPFEESDAANITMGYIIGKITDNLKDAYTMYEAKSAQGEMVRNSALTAVAVSGFGQSAAISASKAANSARAAGSSAGSAAGSAHAASSAAANAKRN